LGIDLEKVKWASLITVSLLCGATAAFSGIIGFVGLIVPHLTRLALGPDHRLLLPASGLFGASFLIAADLLARVVIAPSELPVGIITAFLGAPFFLYLFYLRRRAWKVIKSDKRRAVNSSPIRRNKCGDCFTKNNAHGDNLRFYYPWSKSWPFLPVLWPQ
jgi:hypothetical protein